MIYIIIFISLFFEAALSNIVSLNSLFLPLFSIVSLPLIWPYFKKNDLSFIAVCTLIGFIYDLVFTSMPYTNTIVFLILSVVIILNYRLFKYNIISSNILSVILIVLYRIIGYFILIIIGYLNFSFDFLLKSIYSSLIINLIYGIIIYIIIDLIANIFDKKKNNVKIKKLQKKRRRKYE